MDAFERRGYPTLLIEDVGLDAVAAHQGPDEIDPELEIATKSVDAVGRSQHPMMCVHAHATVLPIGAKALGQIERRVVGNCRSVYLFSASLCLEQFLDSGEL